MPKIKFQGGITKAISSAIAKNNKRLFIKNIKYYLQYINKYTAECNTNFKVVSFSSSRDLHDQILSICSFIRYVGKPTSWIVYSDGTHTQQQIDFLESEFLFVKTIRTDWTNVPALIDNCKEQLLPYSKYLFDYASKMPLGKKLFLYLNHAVDKPTLFIDSDILFYKQAALLNDILHEPEAGWYLPDADSNCLDSRFKMHNSKELYSVNSGFFLLKHDFKSLASGLEFLKSINYEYEYFTEQTIEHIIFKSNKLMPLDPRLFILNSDDQFDFSYLFSRDQIAARHYTGPVRHKMWQRSWKWHLSIK